MTNKEKSKLSKIISAVALSSLLLTSGCRYYKESFDYRSGKNYCSNKNCPGHRYYGERCKR